MTEETQKQREVERDVTNGMGYNVEETYSMTGDKALARSLGDANTGLQFSLLKLDRRSGKIGFGDYSRKYATLLQIERKFREAAIPLEVITTAEGFEAAFDSAYSLSPAEKADLYLQYRDSSFVDGEYWTLEIRSALFEAPRVISVQYHEGSSPERMDDGIDSLNDTVYGFVRDDGIVFPDANGIENLPTRYIVGSEFNDINRGTPFPGDNAPIVKYTADTDNPQT